MRLERAEAKREKTGIYSGKWQEQPQVDEHRPSHERPPPSHPQHRHLLSHDFLLVMKPEIRRGSRPSVATAISSWPRESQKSSRLFKSVSTSAKSGSCNRSNMFFFVQLVAKQKKKKKPVVLQ